MRYIFCFLFLLWGLCAFSNAFLPGAEDIPLMAGMVAEEAPVIFDKQEGQVLLSKVRTTVAARDIFKFYEEALPNLGWIKSGKQTFTRKTQTLKVSLEKTSRGQCVVFSLTESHGH